MIILLSIVFYEMFIFYSTSKSVVTAAQSPSNIIHVGCIVKDRYTESLVKMYMDTTTHCLLLGTSAKSPLRIRYTKTIILYEVQYDVATT